MKTFTGHRKLIAGYAVQLLLNYYHLPLFSIAGQNFQRYFEGVSIYFAIFPSFYLFIYYAISLENSLKMCCEALGYSDLWLVCPPWIFIQRYNRVRFHYVFDFAAEETGRCTGVAVVPYRFLQRAWQPG
jgi:hypothetical protein